MSDRLSDEARAAIAAYRGPVTVCGVGETAPDAALGHFNFGSRRVVMAPSRLFHDRPIGHIDPKFDEAGDA